MSGQVEIDALPAEAERPVSAAGTERAASSTTGGEPAAPQQPLSTSAPAPTPRTVTPADVERILSIEVPVIVRLAHRSMRVREIMQLATGSIIEFDKSADDELDLMINNEIIGRGHAVKAGENFGLRVLRILSMREKIEALGHHVE